MLFQDHHLWDLRVIWVSCIWMQHLAYCSGFTKKGTRTFNSLFGGFGGSFEWNIPTNKGTKML